MEHMGSEDQISIIVEDEEILTADSEIDSACSSFPQFGGFARTGTVTRLEDGNGEHKIIKRSFLKGLGQFGKETKVVAIHKNSYSGFIGQARLESFRIFLEAVARKSGGDANVKYAWYGGSRDEICEIITHGFSRFRQDENAGSYGLGVHLSPANFSIDGALSSAMDENGFRHVLLCRVILGNMEVVCAGSKQIQPSSTEYDSGVDNLLSPRRYTIWSPYMNTHIFPHYIVSFRAPRVTGFERIRMPVARPSSPYMKFPTLLSMLSRFLPRSKMVIITKFYSDYKENNLSRIHLI